jgi:large subunit ribosomal protein L6
VANYYVRFGKNMSRVGRLPVELPDNVTATLEGNIFKVVGSKGELSLKINHKVGVLVDEGKIVISKNVADREGAEQFGLTRTLVANMVRGVAEGFKKELEINGIGYRASVTGENLNLNLGYSHPIEYKVPEDIRVNVEKNIIIISGIDKQKVGQVAAEIRSFRSPEPYKGKGVKYTTETIRRKSGKTGAK